MEGGAAVSLKQQELERQRTAVSEELDRCLTDGLNLARKLRIAIAFETIDELGDLNAPEVSQLAARLLLVRGRTRELLKQRKRLIAEWAEGSGE